MMLQSCAKSIIQVSLIEVLHMIIFHTDKVVPRFKVCFGALGNTHVKSVPRYSTTFSRARPKTPSDRARLGFYTFFLALYLSLITTLIVTIKSRIKPTVYYKTIKKCIKINYSNKKFSKFGALEMAALNRGRVMHMVILFLLHMAHGT